MDNARDNLDEEAIGALRPCRVERLAIRNFRGLRRLDIDFPETGPAVIVGVNGAGKSTILEALHLGFSWMTRRLGSPNGRGRYPDIADIHNGQKWSHIQLSVRLGNQVVGWGIGKSKPGFPAEEPTVVSHLNGWVSRWKYGNLQADHVRDLPLVYYYKVDRSITDIPRKATRPKDPTRFSIYQVGRPGSTLNFRDFFYWFKHQQSIEEQEGEVNPQLEMVRRAIDVVVPGYAKPRVVHRGNKFLMEDAAGKTFDIGQLSDGERTLITLVADIAKRGAMALEGGKEVSLEAMFGVILIDEIELHLHPSWQNRIVGALQETFPGIQFVFTTHSPGILTNVTDENSLLLQDGELFDPLTYGKTANALLQEVFDTDSSAPEIHERFERLRKLIGEGAHDEAQELLEGLRKVLPHDPRVVEADVLLWMPTS